MKKIMLFVLGERVSAEMKQSGWLRPGLNGGDPCELLWSPVYTQQGTGMAALFQFGL